MKAATIYNAKINRANAVSYPNGITKRQIAQKCIDLLLTAAIGIGVAAILLFLVALS